MDTQTWASVVLVVPAVILAIVARKRTGFGLSVRDGAVGEFARGVAFAVPFLVVLGVIFPLAGLSETSRGTANWGSIAAVWVYFMILFLIEEVVFRGLLMSGLGAVTSRGTGLGVTAVLVAAAYLWAPDTGVLPMVGAVVTNVLHGWARWRSGRIWWGLGQRWFWNCGVLTIGFNDSAFNIDQPALTQHLDGPAWLTGGAFGVEGGVVGILLLAVMIAGATRFATGRHGPWTC